MPSSDPPSPYRVPASLRDLVIIDLLELTGSTTATAALLAMSQASVSRRYQKLARELGLRRQNDAPVGSRFGDKPWIGWLRKGVNHHRLANGVLRVGSGQGLQPLLNKPPWADWVSLGRHQQQHWRALLLLELLDAVAVTEPPELTEQDNDQLALVEVRPRCDDQVLLICRRDPLVLEICGGINGWGELP